MGVSRALLYPDPIEFHALPDRILQHYEWHYGIRTIWMDGRKLPPNPPDLPRWWGYSTGRWEGDTLVVESIGHDDRTWIDYFGYPHSDVMHLEERYRRISYDTLELTMTVTDPKYYAMPWKSQTKRLKLLPKGFIKTPEAWEGLLEDLCAPIDEFDFIRTIRDPAGTRDDGLGRRDAVDLGHAHVHQHHVDLDRVDERDRAAITRDRGSS